MTDNQSRQNLTAPLLDRHSACIRVTIPAGRTLYVSSKHIWCFSCAKRINHLFSVESRSEGEESGHRVKRTGTVFVRARRRMEDFNGTDQTTKDVVVSGLQIRVKASLLPMLRSAWRKEIAAQAKETLGILLSRLEVRAGKRCQIELGTWHTTNLSMSSSIWPITMLLG